MILPFRGLGFLWPFVRKTSFTVLAALIVSAQSFHARGGTDHSGLSRCNKTSERL
jgi:hypothetical protein